MRSIGRSAFAAMVAAVGVVGCGGNPLAVPSTPPELFASGTRLRAIYDEIDGLRVLRAWWDTERGEECNFDGSAGWGAPHHCLPTVKRGVGGAAAAPAALVGGGSVGATTLWADAACTALLLSAPTSCAPPRYLVPPAPHSCAEPPRLYLAGARSPGTSVWIAGADGSCTALQGTLAAPALYAVGDPVELDAFVAAREVVEPVSDRIGRVVLVGDDGSRLVIGAADAGRADETSALAKGEDGAMRWLPRWLAAISQGPATLYADAGCTQPAVQTSACPVSAEAEYLDTPGPPLAFRIRTLGPAVATDTLHLLDATNTCVAFQIPAGTEVHGRGDVIPPDAFAPGATVRLGDGPLQRDYYAAGAQPVVEQTPAPLFRDDRGALCDLLPTPDGVLRCLPGGGSTTWWFSDAACTHAVLLLAPPCAPLTVDSLALRIAGVDGCFPDDARVYALGAPETPAKVYTSSSGACVESTAQPTCVVPVGDEQPLAGYPAGVETRD